MFYKWYFHNDVEEVYVSHNRTKVVRTADIIPIEAIQEQLGALEGMTFSEAQIAFFRGTNAFAKDPLGFSQYLRDFRFGEIDAQVSDGQIIIHSNDLLSETFAMNYINELLNHYRALEAGISKEALFREAERVLLAKIPTLKQLPHGSVLEFGTRRRFSKEWQRRELEILLNEVPEIVTATSNVQLAIDFGIPWAGTHPHAGVLLEQLVALRKIYRSGKMTIEEQRQVIRDSHMQFFKNWWEIFPYVSRVALTDTYGDDAFWEDWSYELAYEGRGYRWDSGTWMEWTERTIRELTQGLGIDPSDRYSGKDATYSDGLNPTEMRKITEYKPRDGFRFRAVLFGWGTDGSNDMGKYKEVGFTPISLVMKPYYGYFGDLILFLIKISNNPAKMTEAPPEFQQRILNTFGYQLNEHEFVQPTV